MKYLLILSLLVLSSAARSECFKSLDELANGMERLVGQFPKGLGIQGDLSTGESPLILFVNPNNRHWSIVQQVTPGQFCTTAVGKNWVVPPVGKPS